jgi:hypothetical protein
MLKVLWVEVESAEVGTVGIVHHVEMHLAFEAISEAMQAAPT